MAETVHEGPPVDPTSGKGIQYRPDFKHMQDLLRSEEMKRLLRREAVFCATMAKAIAPTGGRSHGLSFAASIHYEEGTVMDTVNQFGILTRRASMKVVANSDDALTVEFGGKRRYKSGQNREGHHTLRQVCQILGQQHQADQQRELQIFKARDISALPGSKFGGPGTPGGGPVLPGGSPPPPQL